MFKVLLDLMKKWKTIKLKEQVVGLIGHNIIGFTLTPR